MKMQRITLFLLSVLIGVSSSTATAQDNFRPGYVITASGDSLVGDIAYEEGVRNPSNISFRDISNGTTKIYSPLEIREFRAGEDWYIGGVFDIETSPISTSQLTKNSNFQIEQNTVFLRVLFLGEKSLFHLYDSFGREFFYIDKEGEITLLLYKTYLRELRGNDLVESNNQYWGQLSVYLRNCDDIPKSSVAVKYQRRALMKLFDHYYTCTGESLIYRSPNQKSPLAFGLVGGITSTQIGITGTSSVKVDYDYKSSTNIFLGISLEYAFVQKKLSIYNELVYTSFKTDAYDEAFNNFDQLAQTTIELGSSYLKLNNLLRYYLPINGPALYINAGISSGFKFNKINHYKRILQLSSGDLITEDEAIPGESNIESGIMVGAGGKINKISLELRYERSNGLMGSLNSETLKTNSNRYNVIVGYQF